MVITLIGLHFNWYLPSHLPQATVTCCFKMLGDPTVELHTDILAKRHFPPSLTPFGEQHALLKPSQLVASGLLQPRLFGPTKIIKPPKRIYRPVSGPKQVMTDQNGSESQCYKVHYLLESCGLTLNEIRGRFGPKKNIGCFCRMPGQLETSPRLQNATPQAYFVQQPTTKQATRLLNPHQCFTLCPGHDVHRHVPSPNPGFSAETLGRVREGERGQVQ